MKQLKKPFIFIVEDDIIYQEIIKNELQRHGYINIIAFSTGAECLNNLFKMPDIIMLDYNLDESMNGVQILKNIKSVNPNIQVIMLSSQENLEVAINSMKYGAYDYIVKNDVAMNRLSQMVEKIVKWNDLVFENMQFKSIRNKVLVGAGVLVFVAVLIHILMPNLFS